MPFLALFMLLLTHVQADEYDSFISELMKTKLSTVTFDGLTFDRIYGRQGEIKTLKISDAKLAGKDTEVWEMSATTTKALVFRNGKNLIKESVETHGPFGLKSKIINFNADADGVFQNRIEFTFTFDEVTETHFAMDKFDWAETKKIKLPKYVMLPPDCTAALGAEVESCQSLVRGSYSLRFPVFQDFMQAAAVTMCTDGETIRSGLGFKIDAASCNTDESVQAITDAIETMYTDQNMRCLMNINRTFMRELLATIERNQPRIVCGGNMSREEFYTYNCGADRSAACITGSNMMIEQAGAFQSPGRNDLTLMGMTPGSAHMHGMANSQQALASTVMHEMMHLAGHCQGAEHNSYRFDDEVFGCTALCSKHRTEKKMTTKEGCERCIAYGDHATRPSSLNCNIYPSANDRIVFNRAYTWGVNLDQCYAGLMNGTSTNANLNASCRAVAADSHFATLCGGTVNWENEARNNPADGCFNRIRRTNNNKISQVRDRYFAQRNTGPGQHGEHWSQFIKTQSGDYSLATNPARRSRLELDWTETQEYQTMSAFTISILSLPAE